MGDDEATSIASETTTVQDAINRRDGATTMAEMTITDVIGVSIAVVVPDPLGMAATTRTRTDVGVLALMDAHAVKRSSSFHDDMVLIYQTSRSSRSKKSIVTLSPGSRERSVRRA